MNGRGRGLLTRRKLGLGAVWGTVGFARFARARLTSAALLLAACRRKRRSPEERVRALVSNLEAAVEGKDLGPVKAALSKDYRGEDGGDRGTVIATLQMTFLRYPAIHLLVRVGAVEVPAPGRVRAEILVAMASMPVTRADELPRVNAELYEFTVTFAEDGDQLQVVEAKWAPTRLEGFR
jgi:hypothetical protein